MPAGARIIDASVGAGAPAPALGAADGGDIGVGIDELGLDRLAVAAHEDELLALRKAPLDDGRGERREHVLIDRALERPRAHLGREALLQQEFERGGLPIRPPSRGP